MSKVQVIFTAVNAIVLRDNSYGIKYDYPVLVNPRNMALDVPTKYWKMGRNNTIIEMDNVEKAKRDDDIEALGENNDNDIFLPQKEQGQPVSKPFVIQEIKTTPTLHIETKEIRHLDIKPIASFDVNPLKIDPIYGHLDMRPISIMPIDISPIQFIVPKTFELFFWLHAINTLLFSIVFIYILLRG